MAGSEHLGSDLQRAGGSRSCTETTECLRKDFLCRWNHRNSFSGHCLTKNYPDDPVLPPGIVLKVFHARQCASGCRWMTVTGVYFVSPRGCVGFLFGALSLSEPCIRFTNISCWISDIRRDVLDFLQVLLLSSCLDTVPGAVTELKLVSVFSSVSRLAF